MVKYKRMFSVRQNRSNQELLAYPVGWYGDSGLGEELILKILAGRKTATLGPAYDPHESKVGERFRLVDKAGRQRAVIRITNVEFLAWEDLSQEHADRLDLTFDQIRTYFEKYLARQFRPDEEIRITSFEVVK